MSTPALSERKSSADFRTAIKAAKAELREKFRRLDVMSLDVSDYNKRYLGHTLKTLDGALEIYEHLLLYSFDGLGRPLGDTVFVDYGGGSGFFSFFAIQAGVKEVIYTDIYDVSCADARKLGRALGIELEHVVCGDIDDLINYITARSLSVDLISSYNVLEHIYDVEDHLKKLRAISENGFRVVHASTANRENKRVERKLMSEQIEAETRTREKQWGHKERDSVRALLDMRKDIINAYAPGMKTEAVDELARLTRGLIKADIEKAVDEYRKKGTISYKPDHSTNTCDPYTGNWSEHLIDLQWLQRVAEGTGYSARIAPGYYTHSGPFIQQAVKVTLNQGIRFLGRGSMRFAPYYILDATYKR